MRENNAVRERLRKKIGLEQLWSEGEGISRLTPSGMLQQAFRMALSSILASPYTALMTLFTMVFSLFLFSLFLLFVENVNRSLVGTQSEISMSIYLRDSVDDTQRQRLQELFHKSSIVRSQKYIDKQSALDSFRQAVGADSALIEGIEGSNPLPASFELTFRSVDELEKQMEDLAQTLKQDPIVEHVEYSRGMVSALVSALKSIQYLGTCAVFVMLFLSGFIITVAIRLALYAHRDEIEIMYLVGAKRTFIRSPYMIEGFTQGIVGAVISLIILSLIYMPLSESIKGPVARMIFAEPHFLSFASILLVLALGTFVGVMGSYAAVRKVSTVTIGD